MRLIDAEWLKELYKPWVNYEGKMYSVPVGAILANIDDAPSIDIVWCKECVHNGEYTDCPLNAYAKTDYSFCSYGEREESE